jgi:hypothetical protein
MESPIYLGTPMPSSGCPIFVSIADDGATSNLRMPSDAHTILLASANETVSTYTRNPDFLERLFGQTE